MCILLTLNAAYCPSAKCNEIGVIWFSTWVCLIVKKELVNRGRPFECLEVSIA